jgi:transposase-like protein
MIRPGRERLSGTVEVDEILLGGKRLKLEGRSKPGKILVLIAVEDKKSRGIGRIRMQIIPDATMRSLRTAIKDMVEPGSIVRTDGWTGYSGIERHGYSHKINKRQPGVPGDDPTPLIHRVSSLLKRWLLGTHQGGVKSSHLHSYLDEFVFRFNRRTSRSRGKLFYRLVQNLIATPL